MGWSASVGISSSASSASKRGGSSSEGSSSCRLCEEAIVRGNHKRLVNWSSVKVFSTLR